MAKPSRAQHDSKHMIQRWQHVLLLPQQRAGSVLERHMATGQGELGFLLPARKQVAFELSTERAVNRGRAAAGSSSFVSPSQGRRAEKFPQSRRSAPGRGRRLGLAAQLQPGRHGGDAVVPGLAVQVADRSRGQFSCLCLWLKVKLVIGNTVAASSGGGCFPLRLLRGAGCQHLFSLQLAEPG